MSAEIESLQQEIARLKSEQSRIEDQLEALRTRRGQKPAAKPQEVFVPTLLLEPIPSAS